MTPDDSAATRKRPVREKTQRPLVGREPLADQSQVALYLGVTEKCLENWRYREVGPRYIRVGQNVRYRWADVDEWVANNTVDAKAAA